MKERVKDCKKNRVSIIALWSVLAIAVILGITMVCEFIVPSYADSTVESSLPKSYESAEIIYSSGNNYYATTAYTHTHSWSGWKHNSECHWQYCVGCEQFKNVEYHKLVEYERVNATCTKNGYVRYKCKCGYKCRKILKSSNAHSYGSGKVILSATCNQKGIKQYTCSKCGSVKKVYIAPTDTHRYDNGVVTRYATCSTKGTKVYTCRDCGKQYSVAISATGKHTYGSGYVYRKATCYQEGINAYPCLNCDHVYYEYTSKANHSYDSGVITTVATCTSPGVKTYTCKWCGKKVAETIKSSGSHTCYNWSSNDECHWHRCTKCNADYDVQWHSFDGGTVTVSPTEYSTGTKAYRCKVCGYTKYETIPKKSSTSVTGKINIVPASEIYFASQEVIFTLKFEGVTSLQGVKVYIDGYQINPDNITIVTSGSGKIIYRAAVIWGTAGQKVLSVDTSNCGSSSVYINVQ